MCHDIILLFVSRAVTKKLAQLHRIDPGTVSLVGKDGTSCAFDKTPGLDMFIRAILQRYPSELQDPEKNKMWVKNVIPKYYTVFSKLLLTDIWKILQRTYHFILVPIYWHDMIGLKLLHLITISVARLLLGTNDCDTVIFKLISKMPWEFPVRLRLDGFHHTVMCI